VFFEGRIESLLKALESGLTPATGPDEEDSGIHDASQTAYAPDGFRSMVIEVLELDPRPAFQKRQMPVNDAKVWGSRFGFELMGFDIKYEIRKDGFWVTQITRL
jgi:hypothetical protein